MADKVNMANNVTGAAEHDTAPIFIVGAPRSGTTLLRLVLNKHVKIGIPTETEFFPVVYERYAQKPARWGEAVELFIDRCERRLLPPLDLAAEREELLALGAPDYGRLLRLPLAAWAAAEGKRRWGEKTPLHIFHADAIVRLFPEAKLLVMLRDPRATVASMNRFSGIGSGTALNARLWRDAYSKGAATVQQLVPTAQALTVRYERLVSTPEDTMKEVCEFLGEAFDPALLDFHESSGRYADLPDTPKISQPIHADPDEWRAQLSDGELTIVESICGPTMEALGYAKLARPLRVRERGHIAASRAYVAAKQLQHRRLAYHPVTYRPFARFRQSG